MKQILLAVFLMGTFYQVCAQSTWFIQENGSGDGTSWANASSALQQVIDAAQEGDSIFVAAGLYQPAPGTYFSLKQGVKVYGSFAGNESSLRQRNINSGITSILQNNGKHVVFNDNIGLDATTVLDGFKITGGYATGNALASDKYGGGIYNYACSPTLTHLIISDNGSKFGGGGIANFSGSNPVMKHVEISNNTGENQGAGMYNRGSSPILDSVNIINNTVEIEGGGIYSSSSSAVLTHVTIMGNISNSSGGGMFSNGSTLVLNHVTISNNYADFIGGGMANEYASPQLTDVNIRFNVAGTWGGGVFNLASSPLSRNVTINNNIAREMGGAIYNRSSPKGGPSPQLTNVLISNNRADISGGGIYNEESSPNLINVTMTGNAPDAINSDGNPVYIKNSIIWGNNAGLVGSTYETPSFSLIQGITQNLSNGNISGDSDPSFVNAAGGDYQLALTSPAVDAGTTDTTGLSLPLFDLAGQPRIVNDRVDMGVYENQSTAPLPVTIRYFKGSLEKGVASFEWESGVESGFSHFAVEKLLDHSTQVKDTGLETIKAKGNNHVYTYRTIQSEPTASYRLKLVDKDGHAAYFNKIVVLTQGAGAAYLLIYPNPAADFVFIKGAAAGTLHVFDANGRLLKQLAVSAGVNKINVSDLSSGVYYGELNGQKFRFIKR